MRSKKWILIYIYIYFSRLTFCRSVHITKDAPFPPIIPAIYTAYYNFITNSQARRKSNKHNKH
jgi:hypothetical protein